MTIFWKIPRLNRRIIFFITFLYVFAYKANIKRHLICFDISQKPNYCSDIVNEIAKKYSRHVSIYNMNFRNESSNWLTSRSTVHPFSASITYVYTFGSLQKRYLCQSIYYCCVHIIIFGQKGNNFKNKTLSVKQFGLSVIVYLLVIITQSLSNENASSKRIALDCLTDTGCLQKFP